MGCWGVRDRVKIRVRVMVRVRVNNRSIPTTSA